VAGKPGNPCRISPAIRAEDMDTSHSRLLTAGGPREALLAYHGAGGCGADRLPTAKATASCALGTGLASVGTGRSFTRTALRRWGLAELSDQAELVVSELVTNAIRHGLLSARRTIDEYPVGLRLLAQRPFVTCMVTDPGGRMPLRNAAAADAESGRGLQVVESCSVRWGWQPLPAGGKVVWALLRED
jgi:anti-sigma regulatory factor (Ser/Thr protein kinase)